jgi:hypothetical protein
MEEIKNEEVIEEVVENCDIPEVSSDNMIGKIVAGAVVVCTGALAALAYKNREKLDEIRIKKLEKKGYTVYKPEDDQYQDFDDSEESEE